MNAVKGSSGRSLTKKPFLKNEISCKTFGSGGGVAK